MKRLFIVLACCCLVACSKTDENVTISPSSQKLFHGSFADESTRTFIDEAIRLRWTADDLITIFEGTTRNKKYKFLGETGDNAGDFDYVSQGFGTGNDVDRYYAIYPYASSNKLHENGYITYILPSEQTYAENTFGLGANPMVAVTADLDDFDLSFRNVGGYLRLLLYGTDTTIKSIKIEGHDGEPLAGKVYITPNYGGTPTSEMDASATTSVTLTCPEGVTLGSSSEEATPFWIVLPPTNFSKGFTITVTGFYGGTYTKSYNADITIKRNLYLSALLDATITPASGVNIGINSWDTDNEDNGGSAE